MRTTPRFEHLFPYSSTSDFVLKRTVVLGERSYSVLVLGNYAPYSGDEFDVWGVALSVDGERTYLAGGHRTLPEAMAGARGCLATLLSIKNEHGEEVYADEQDIVNFVLTRGELDNEMDSGYHELRRGAGY